MARLLQDYGQLAAAARRGAVPSDLLARIQEAADAMDLEYLSQEIPKAVQEALEGLAQVTGIVRAMKAFSHSDPAEKAAADINQVIAHTLTISHNEWKYVANLVTDFDAELPPVPCLSGRLSQVILNLAQT